MITRLKDFFRGIYYEFYKLFIGRYPDMPMTESIEGELITGTTSTSDATVINPETFHNWSTQLSNDQFVFNIEQRRRLVEEQRLLAEPRMLMQQNLYANLYGQNRGLSPNIEIRNVSPVERDRIRLEMLYTLHQNGMITDQMLLETTGITGIQTSAASDVFVNHLPEAIVDPPKEIEPKVNPFIDQERIIDLE
jgi:hypothetical protein